MLLLLLLSLLALLLLYYDRLHYTILHYTKPFAGGPDGKASSPAFRRENSRYVYIYIYIYTYLHIHTHMYIRQAETILHRISVAYSLHPRLNVGFGALKDGGMMNLRVEDGVPERTQH